MYFYKFPPPNDSSTQKLKLNVNNNIYIVKLSLCLENSHVISDLFADSRDKLELKLDINNKNQQFKIIARLLTGRKIFFNSYNSDYIEYAARKLKINDLHEEILKYKNYITISEHNNFLYKFSKLETTIFNLNSKNFDKVCTSELFCLSEEEIPLVSHIIYHICSNFVQKAPILLDLLVQLNLKNKLYVQSFLNYIFDIDDWHIKLFLISNLYQRKLIDKQDLKINKFDFFLSYDSIEDSNGIEENDTEKFSEFVEESQKGLNLSEIAIVIRNDDINLLQQLSSEEKFDFNQKIPNDSYDRVSFLSEATLLQYSAAFGSVKCFKFLLINGADFDANLAKYAIYGGSPEILRICEQNKCNFDTSLFAAATFHRDIIFDWLFDTKFQVESSTDICSYAFHGRDYIYQQWFSCKQCNFVGHYGICFVCSKKCHLNHNGMKYSKMTNCFCDCGESGNCCCMPSSDSDYSDDEGNENNEEDEEEDAKELHNSEYYDSDNESSSENSSSNDNIDTEAANNDNDDKYDIKNIYEKYQTDENKAAEDEDDDDDEDYKEKDNKPKKAIASTPTLTPTLTAAITSSTIKKKKKKKKKKVPNENSRKFVSSGELVISCYKNYSFKCLMKLIRNGVDIIKSQDPPLLVEAVKNNDIAFVKYLLRFPDIDVNNSETVHIYSNPLLIACTNKLNEIFDILIDHPKIDINVTDNLDCTPLHKAVENNNVHMVEELLKNPEIQVNKPNLKNVTPIALCCKNGNYKIFEILFNRKDIDLNVSRKGLYGKQTENIFLDACQSGSIQIVRKLIDSQLNKATKSNNETKPTNNNETDENKVTNNNGDDESKATNNNGDDESKATYTNETDESKATNNNETDESKTTNKNEIDESKITNKNETDESKATNNNETDESKTTNKNETDESKTTNTNKGDEKCVITNNESQGTGASCPDQDLIHAMQKNESITSMIMDVNIQGNNALHLACKSGNVDLIQLLLSTHLFDINSPNYRNFTPLRFACMSRNIEAFKLITQQEGVDLNSFSKFKQTPLHFSCQSNYHELTNYILENKMYSVNDTDFDKKTPLYYACDSGDKETVERLLEEPDIDPNIQNVDGNTPLHAAAISESTKVIEILLNDSRVLKNLPNLDNQTPIFNSMVYLTSFECFKLFAKDNGVDIHFKDNQKRSVLYYACGFDARAVELIIDRCKDEINDKTVDSMTPLHNACLVGDADIVKILLKVPGIKVNEVNDDGDTPYSLTLNPEIQMLINDFMNNQNNS